MNNYTICNSTEHMNLDLIYDFVSNSYWAKGIPRETMDKAVKNSLSYGVFDEKKNQVGFARIVTDSATLAYIAYLFIVKDHRGKGLSKLLIEKILKSKELQDLRRILLATKDAH